ncbi:MAG: RluA family pseudouridine synthase, partial [Akkermansiaceae bacterium]
FTHIGRHPVNRQKMAVISPPGGKTAITDYEVIAPDLATKTALVLCHLHTGRTHQIRVHLQHIGTPILGDPIYTKKHSLPTPRLLLHAWKLSFNHPVTGKKLSFTAPPPAEFDPWLPENFKL